MILQLITMHHLGGEWRIPAHLAIPKEKLSHGNMHNFPAYFLDNGYKNPCLTAAEMLDKVNVPNEEGKALFLHPY